MASSFSQSPFFSSLIPINKKTSTFSTQTNNFFTFKNSKIPSFNGDPSPNPQENETESQTPEAADPIKLAFAKAKAYKKSIIPNAKSVQIPLEESFNEAGVYKEVPLAVKLAIKKAEEYKKNRGVLVTEEINSKIVQDSVTKSGEVDEKNEVVKSDEVVKDNGKKKEVPLALKIAMEKANEYKKNKGVVDISETLASELSTTDNLRSPGEKKSTKSAGNKEELTISSIDFVGLGFSDKKSGRSLPAGLVPLSDPFPEGDLPEVEIIVGDTSKFDNASSASISAPVTEEETELYKPKVSTWGVFPRPNDISKTYGGGRTLRPGEALETAEEKAAKQARTKQLLAAYKNKFGMNIDPKLKSECQKALTDGDSLMDHGKLTEALPFYEKIMEKLPFQTELHGLAALQWSICQDSMSRPNEARMMYEKLQSHPIPKVSKKARQFVFGFQAMEMLKVKSSGQSRLTGYQNYFDAFVKDKTNYSSLDDEVDEAAMSQALPYVIFLVSPIIVVLLIAASR